MKQNRFKKHEWTVQGRGHQTLKIVYRDGKVEYTQPVVVNDMLYSASILAEKGESILSIENVTKGKLVYPV